MWAQVWSVLLRKSSGRAYECFTDFNLVIRCGDVMKLQIRVDEDGIISDVKFKTFGCGSAIASSSYMTERVKGLSLEEAEKIKNTEIAKELCLPPVKLHCSSEFLFDSITLIWKSDCITQCWQRMLSAQRYVITAQSEARLPTPSSLGSSTSHKVPRREKQWQQLILLPLKVISQLSRSLASTIAPCILCMNSMNVAV